MKCPLLKGEIKLEDADVTMDFIDCLKEECAWWVKASESCAMEAIPRIIGYVGSELKTIKDTMPHEE